MTSVADISTDAELLDRFRRGDGGAAAAVYERYADRLRVTIRRQCSPDLAARVDAEDLLQSAFGSFFRRVADRPAEGTDAGHLWGLLLLIAVHKVRDAADYHRAAKRDARRTSAAPLDDSRLSPPAGPDESSFSELCDLVDHLVARLPDPEGRIVRLRIEGHEVPEIATRTARSRRTVERVLQAFRRSLETQLREV